MRRVCFVHRNFRDEIGGAFAVGNMLIDLCGFENGEQIFGGDLLNFVAAQFERADDAGNGDFAGQFRVALDETV